MRRLFFASAGLAVAVATSTTAHADVSTEPPPGSVHVVSPPARVAPAVAEAASSRQPSSAAARSLGKSYPPAWRDDVDIEDARRLLASMPVGPSADETWGIVESFVPRGREQTARDAFLDLWEVAHGPS